MKAKYSFTTPSLMLLLMLGICMANDMNNTAVAVLNRHIITIGNYKNPVYDDTGDGSSPSPSGRKAAILNNKINNDYIKDDLKKQILMTIIEYQAFTEKFCTLLKDIKNSTGSTHKYKANNVNEMMKIIKAYIVSFGINEDYVENLRYKPNVEYNFELFCATLQELDLDEQTKMTDLESNIKYAFVVNQVIDYMWMMIGRINSTNFENAKAIFRKLASDAEVSKIERERKLFTHVEEIYRSTAHLASSGCQVKLKVGSNNAMSINDVRLTLGLRDNDSYKSLYYEDKLYTSIYNFLGAYGDARDYDAMVHVQLRDEEFFNHVLKDLLSNGDALNKLKHGIERNHSEIHDMICISMPVISLNKANECYSINSIFEKETDLDKIIALLTAYRDKIIGGYLDEDFLVLADLRTKMEQKHLQSGTAKTVKFILFTDKKVFMDYFMKLLNERKDIDKVKQILELYNDIYRNVDYSFASNLWIESVGMSKYLGDNKSDL